MAYYSHPEQRLFAGQGMQSRNLHYQAPYPAEIPSQQYQIYNIGQQVPPQFYHPIPQHHGSAVEAIEPASSTHTAQEQQLTLSSENADEPYDRYQQGLKTTFEAISEGKLAEAGIKIMNLSRWLLTNVVKLGELPVLRERQS
jgi:hypothetical protein